MSPFDSRFYNCIAIIQALHLVHLAVARNCFDHRHIDYTIFLKDRLGVRIEWYLCELYLMSFLVQCLAFISDHGKHKTVLLTILTFLRLFEVHNHVVELC